MFASNDANFSEEGNNGPPCDAPDDSMQHLGVGHGGMREEEETDVDDEVAPTMGQCLNVDCPKTAALAGSACLVLCWEYLLCLCWEYPLYLCWQYPLCVLCTRCISIFHLSVSVCFLCLSSSVSLHGVGGNNRSPLLSLPRPSNNALHLLKSKQCLSLSFLMSHGSSIRHCSLIIPPDCKSQR